MSIESKAEERLESLIKKFSHERRISPFQKKQKVMREKPSPSSLISISGDGNAAITGSNNQVSIKIIKPTTKVIANLKPGAIHITDRQAATLKEMVASICSQTGKSYQHVWNRLLRHMVVPQYRLIPAAAYTDAANYLQSWLDRLNEDVHALRRRHLAYIKVNQRKIKLSNAELTAYIQRQFGKYGLKTCSIKELEEIRNFVNTWKPH